MGETLAVKLAGTRPTVAEFLRVAEQYAAEHETGGSLHIVVDDGNLSDSNVAFCVEYALENGDGYGAALALLLTHMSRSQRGRVGQLWGRS